MFLEKRRVLQEGENLTRCRYMAESVAMLTLGDRAKRRVLQEGENLTRCRYMAESVAMLTLGDRAANAQFLHLRIEGRPL